MTKIAGLALPLLLAASGASAASINGYPASCFPQPSQPLPDPGTAEPFIASGIIDLDDRSGFGNPYAFSIYRVGCPGGGAAVLVKLRSQGQPSGRAPRISIVQGATTVSDARYSIEPYTLREGVGREENIDLGRVFVLNSSNIDFTAPMTIRIEGRTSATMEVPAYDPTRYPQASEKLPIAGYVSGSYYDPAKPGEGMLIEVAPAETISVAWYTFKADGSPLWLVGGGPVCVDLGNNAGAPLFPGGKAVCISPPALTEVELFAFEGGGFAGAFDPNSVNAVAWGKVRLSWVNCSTVDVELRPASSAAALPTATGTLRWTRLTGVQGAACE